MAEHLTKWTKILAWTAAAAFAASWFLPVLDDVPGWMAFRYALAPLVPYSDAGDLTWDDSIPQVLSALTNVVFAILFGLWVARQTVRPGLLVRITLACFLLNLYWFVKAWRDDGPIRRTYEQQVREEFMRSSFLAPDEVLQFRSAEMSEASRVVLQRKLARLTSDFNELAELDRHLPSREKRSVALMMACRPWVFSMFDGLRKR